ncbi:lonely Cys domain-containing protein [Streptomyces sp. VB1]|uniref:lonely Cys domain-containing protein n=1 Tax=Streptomyces sp. VB1 TaxID=2986803 RepID=UPI003A0FDB79
MRLDALRRAVTGSPLREGPFDLDAVTRYVLGLGEREAVTKVQRGELFRVALDENVEGARSLAGLAAFRLVLDGVFSVARTLPRTGGSRGRNWTGGRIRELDMSQAVGVAQQPYGVPPLGEADPAPYVVLAAEGGHDHVVVLDGDGTPHRVTTEVFAELLALDPLLAGLPDGTPVVLLVPEAGARGLDLPRAVADRTGRTTWATSGRGGRAIPSPPNPGSTTAVPVPGARELLHGLSGRRVGRPRGRRAAAAVMSSSLDRSASYRHRAARSCPRATAGATSPKPSSAKPMPPIRTAGAHRALAPTSWAVYARLDRLPEPDRPPHSSPEERPEVPVPTRTPRGGGGVCDAQQAAGDVADSGVPAVLEALPGPVRATALGDPGVSAGHRPGLQLRHDVVGLLVSDPDDGQGLEDREPRLDGRALSACV